MQGIQEARNKMKSQCMEDIKPEIPISFFKHQFMKTAQEKTGGRFVVDERNRPIVSDLFNYFMGIDGNLDLTKGLWLEGPVGTGKSTLMRVFSAFTRKMQKGFKVFACSEITTCYSIDGNLDMFLKNEHGVLGVPVEICFDELGREPVPAGYYGNKMNVMQHILHIRYSLWQTGWLRTFVTTNMDADNIGTIYGDYIRDRRKEMFNIIPVTGESRR